MTDDEMKAALTESLTGERPSADGLGLEWYRLRQPFPPQQVGKLPRSGTLLDYVGHGAVTSRLLEVDPRWTWEPVALNEDGTPKFDEDEKGDYVGLWITLTVRGVSRLGYGSVPSGTSDAIKQLIGDAIRNAAMRFGVALDLWIKGHVPEDDERNVPDARRASGRAPAPVPQEVGQSVAKPFYDRAEKDGYTRAQLDEVASLAVGRAVTVAQVYRTEWSLVRDAWAAYKISAASAASPASGQGDGEPAPGDETAAPASTEGVPSSQGAPATGAAELGSKAKGK